MPASLRSSEIAVLDWHGLAVGPIGGHRVEGVACGDDPGADRDLLAGQAVRVPVSVPALVVSADDDARLLQNAPDPVEHALALDGVCAHDIHLFVCEPPGLVDDFVRHRDLPDVVEQRPELEVPQLSLVQAESLADLVREHDDAARMGSRVLVGR